MSIPRKLWIAGLLSVAMAVGAAWAQKPLTITFTVHSSASNSFWQTVKKGYDDACKQVGADCRMVFTQTEGDLNQELSNMQAVLARGTDVLLTTIPNDTMFDQTIKDAIDKGVIVLAVNVDDSKGAAGNARLAFIGQDFVNAGYALAKGIFSKLPASGPVHVLVGISAPGQNWSEQRGAGVIKYIKEYAADHPDRKVTYDRIDSGTDLAVTASRVTAYLQAHPDTSAYIDTGYWDAGVASSLKDNGTQPGKILIGGFDLVPQVLKLMEDGYIQFAVDQQPYLQGYIPVIQVNLMKKYGLSAWDVDTGHNLVTPAEAPAVLKLAQEGYR